MNEALKAIVTVQVFYTGMTLIITVTTLYACGCITRFPVIIRNPRSLGRWFFTGKAHTVDS
ncbi:hypothetical protein ACIP5Z_02230 [Rothia terrae]|uniref:hypothetical protein n=1 Tax=Rothia terrae TaxID=396015 RepID=UPI00382758D5